MKRWVADLSTTNFRIFVSIMLAAVLVLTLLVGLMLKIELQEGIVWALVAFVGAMLGIDVQQFSIKRKTEIVTPPQVTAEHAAAAVTVLTKADADKAAKALEENQRLNRGEAG